MINFRYFKTFNGSGSNPNYYIYLHIVDFYPVLIDIITSSSHIEYLQVLLLYICNPDLQYVYKPYNIFTTIFTAFILHTQTYFTGPLHEASQHLQCKPRPHGYKCIKTTLSLCATLHFSPDKRQYTELWFPVGKHQCFLFLHLFPFLPSISYICNCFLAYGWTQCVPTLHTYAFIRSPIFSKYSLHS